jgi:hypothetical protein
MGYGGWIDKDGNVHTGEPPGFLERLDSALREVVGVYIVDLESEESDEQNKTG